MGAGACDVVMNLRVIAHEDLFSMELVTKTGSQILDILWKQKLTFSVHKFVNFVTSRSETSF
jgi:hypothetical protein